MSYDLKGVYTQLDTHMQTHWNFRYPHSLYAQVFSMAVSNHCHPLPPIQCQLQ